MPCSEVSDESFEKPFSTDSELKSPSAMFDKNNSEFVLVLDIPVSKIIIIIIMYVVSFSKEFKFLVLILMLIKIIYTNLDSLKIKPSFFRSDFRPVAKRSSLKSERKKRGSITYSTNREKKVSKIYI